MAMSEEKNYYTMPWIKQRWVDIKEYFKEKKKKFHFPWVKLGIFFGVIIILLAIFLIVKQGTLKFPTKDAYDKTGFISSDQSESEYVFDNDRYHFVLNATTTHFMLTDKTTGMVWSSAPENNTSVDTLTLYYPKSLGVPASVGNYANSINYHDQKRFEFRVDKQTNTLEVLYLVGGKIVIDYTDLPKLISKDRFENFVLVKADEYIAKLKEDSDPNYKAAKKKVDYLKNYYKINDQVANPYYALDNPEKYSKERIQDLYDVLYKYVGYTAEDLEKDCLENGVSINKTYPTFEVSLKYQLKDTGLDVSLVNDSIVDFESEPLVYVDVLPYFGCVNQTDAGYALIPDGSGILLDFNSTKSYANSYEARIYGEDYAKEKDTLDANVEKVSLGVYGIHSTNSVTEAGFVNIIKNGATNCSLISHICTKNQLNTDYNRCYYRYYYRESDTNDFSSLSGFSEITSWTNSYSTSSLDLSIRATDNSGSYVDMAKTYQDYLVEQGTISKNSNPSLSLNLTLLGGYVEKTNFLGIPYSKVSSLTTSKQALEIAKSLKNDHVNNVNLIYSGFSNGGIETNYMGSFDYNSSIATKKKLNNLVSELSKLSIDFYPQVSISSCYSKKQINNKMIIKNLYGEICPRYGGDEAVLLADKESTPRYYLLGSTYEKTITKITKALTYSDTPNLSFNDFGNLLYGSYKSKQTIFRDETMQQFQTALTNAESKTGKTMITYPNDYALAYTDMATAIPFTGSNYQVCQTSVPFYQLVLSGYVPYSTIDLNLNDKYQLLYYKMKAIETLSSIAMTWTYDETIDLIQTEYDHLYSTYYKNWYDRTTSLYQELNELGIYSSSLDSHEILVATGEVAISTYSNGMKILFNYRNSDYSYQGITIPANSYKVVKGGD
jgi:hypothetical protein